MKAIEKRLVLLEKQMEIRQAAKRQHAPFYHIAPWSILRDQTIVSYYPEGLYQPPERHEDLPFAPVMQWVMENCEQYHISGSMAFCTEWRFLSSQNDPGYTDEQKERFRKDWMEKYPELELLYTDEQCIKLRKMIERLPQNGVFQRKQSS